MPLLPPKIKSKYKEKESFTFREAPKNFDSVTNTTIRKLNKYCLAKNERVFKDKYAPGALKAMLTAVAGQFNYAHRQLEGDYSNRKGKLELAYIDGIAEIESQIIEFKKQVAEHNILFEQYNKANIAVTGEKLPENLIYKESNIFAIEEKCERLRKATSNGK